MPLIPPAIPATTATKTRLQRRRDRALASLEGEGARAHNIGEFSAALLSIKRARPKSVRLHSVKKEDLPPARKHPDLQSHWMILLAHLIFPFDDDEQPVRKPGKAMPSAFCQSGALTRGFKTFPAKV